MKTPNTNKQGRIIIPKGCHVELLQSKGKRAVTDDMDILNGCAGTLTIGQKKGNTFFPSALYAPVQIDEQGRIVKPNAGSPSRRK